MRVLPRAAVVLGGLLLVVLSGCGGGGEFGVAPVKGKVTCNGQPVADATITFSPIASESGDAVTTGKGAVSQVDAEGNYELSTYDTHDGAVVGRHRVTVEANDPKKPLACRPPEDLEYEVKSGDNEINIELSGGSAT